MWDDALCEYDFGPYHPMSPVRLELTRLLAAESGLLDRPGVQILPAPVASDEELLTVHEPDYLDAVRRASGPEGVGESLLRFGIGGDDVPAFPGMHTASARVAGGSLAAVDAILAGHVRSAVNVAGGMHHAKPGAASGFCVYNDAALAVRRALDHGAERVLYVDVDVHHGDGVERALWDEPRAVTLSIHETGERLFPGTGFVQDTGGPGATGSAINVPLPPRTDADGWVRAIRAVVPPLARAVRPTLLVTQHGADTHRWLSRGAGGSAGVAGGARSGAPLVAIATGDPIDAEAPLPPAYLEAAARARADSGLSPEPGIRTFGDGRPLAVRDWSGGFDPEDALDRAVQAARRVAFPEWGLDPFLD